VSPLESLSLPATSFSDPVSLAAVVQRYAAEPSTWRPLLADPPAAPDPEPGVAWTVPIVTTGQLVVKLVGWLPGRSTRAHDHGGVAGAWTVVEGELVEDHVAEDAWWARPARRRVGPGTSVLMEPDRVHVVANPGREVAVSIHASAPKRRPARYPAVGVASILAEAAPWPSLKG
jgi:predicted metal-dependent enzyme (double-stranded beta helix superfamily)